MVRGQRYAVWTCGTRISHAVVLSSSLVVKSFILLRLAEPHNHITAKLHNNLHAFMT